MAFNVSLQKEGMKKRRFSITLIELLIVMILIATITGALAYNYRDSLNEGKAFKTKEGISRIETIITIFLAEHPTQDVVNVDWEQVIRSSSLVKNPDSFLKDGWGNPYEISVAPDDDGNTQVVVRSREYDAYRQRKGLK